MEDGNCCLNQWTHVVLIKSWLTSCSKESTWSLSIKPWQGLLQAWMIIIRVCVCKHACLWCLCLMLLQLCAANKASSQSFPLTAGCAYTGCVCVCFPRLQGDYSLIQRLINWGEIHALKMSHKCYGSYCKQDSTHSVGQAVCICGKCNKFSREQLCFLWLLPFKVHGSLFRCSQKVLLKWTWQVGVFLSWSDRAQDFISFDFYMFK